MENILCVLIALIAPSALTLAVATALVQEKDGKPPLLKNIFWTFGLACLAWAVISVYALRWQLRCVEPAEVVEWGGCGINWLCITGPILLTTGVVFVYSIGCVLWQLVKRQSAKNIIDWRDGKPRWNPSPDDLLDE